MKITSLCRIGDEILTIELLEGIKLCFGYPATLIILQISTLLYLVASMIVSLWVLLLEEIIIKFLMALLQ